jgi:hypothetical protein
MPRYRVKQGYHLQNGNEAIPPGTEIVLSESFAALQLWKLDLLDEAEPVAVEEPVDEGVEVAPAPETAEEVKEARAKAKEARAKTRVAKEPKVREVTE